MTKWYGSNSSRDGCKTFYYRLSEGDSWLRSQFEDVRAELDRLTTEKDKYGIPVVELEAEGDGVETRQRFIAFRFTSDWAHNFYSARLQAKGLSLGRGSFRPWTIHGDYDFYIGDNADEDTSKKGRPIY